jgi:hypothetical protein
MSSNFDELVSALEGAYPPGGTLARVNMLRKLESELDPVKISATCMNHLAAQQILPEIVSQIEVCLLERLRLIASKLEVSSAIIIRGTFRKLAN